MFKNLKIRNKLLMIFLVTGLIPMVILSVMAFFQSSGILEETILHELQLFNIMVEEKFDNYFEEKFVDGESMADTMRIANALEAYNEEGPGSEAWDEAYENLATFVPEFEERYGLLSVYIVSPEGQGIYASGEYKSSLEGSDFSTRPYFQSAIAGEQNLSQFEYSSILDQYFIAIATPIRDPQTNAVIGTINGLIPISQIEDVLHASIGEVGESGDAYLVDADGLLLTNTRLGEYTQDAAFVETINTHAVDELREPIRSGNDEFLQTEIYDDYLGNPVLGAFTVTSIGNTPVGMIIELDESEGLAPVNALLRNLVIIVAVILVLAIAITLYTATSVAKPLAKIAQVVTDKFAEGDFTEELDDEAKDETGQLAKAMNRMGNKISLAMANINSASEQVAAGSKQVSDSSTDLSQGATEQASSVEELTSAIEQIASQTKSNAETATKTKKLSEDTKDNAVLGNQKMQEMIGAMGEINDSSKNISRIIKVIDEIAFQTNILALNAAVEAARAGQHGKGFAVVAEEVRNLAARSADAAKETTDLIEGSVRKVDEGTEIANLTAKELDKIVEAIGDVAELVEDISNASNEQSLGVEQINEGINQISDVVQTTSATSEETAAASEELSGQAELLREQVSQFKIRNVNNGNQGSNFDQAVNTYYQKPAAEKEEEADKADTLDFSNPEFGKY